MLNIFNVHFNCFFSVSQTFVCDAFYNDLGDIIEWSLPSMPFYAFFGLFGLLLVSLSLYIS